MKTVAKISIFVFILLLGLSGLGIYWTFYRSLPDYSGTQTINALKEPVDIHWDRWGIPHIYAKNEDDLYFSLGYVHARDRLWQMTLTQLAAEGRLAEYFGEDLLPVDIHQRTIGFWEISRQIEATLSDSSLRILEAYANGVNTYIEKHPAELSPQFALAGIDPLEWTPTHSIALSRLMAWQLNIAWKNELSLATVANKLPPDKFSELLSADDLISDVFKRTDNNQIDPNFAQLMLERDRQLRKILGTEGYRAGSNAWAVNSEKSATGAPLLAGDPHLGLSIPGKWYEVHLNLDGKNLSGATLAGAPAVILGQNDFLAWSFTNIMADDTDFFIEAVNPDNPDQYILDTLAGEPVFEQFEKQREVIGIKGKADTVVTRRLTRHGPVISSVYPDSTLTAGKVVAMKWTGNEVSNELKTLIQINWAQSFDQFRKALPHFKVPGQNIIYADKAGNIALYSLASIPIRLSNPVIFRKGWEPENDWQGYVRFEQLPSIVNPESGWIANANNPVNPGSYSYYISVYWEPDSRFNRIRQYLTQNELISPVVFQVMQNDSYSDYAREMTGYLLPILKNSDADFSVPVSYLENWDFRYELNETAASIMDAFIIRLSRNTFQDEFGEEAYNNFIRHSGLPANRLLSLVKENSSFFDDLSTEQTESRADIMIKSMHEALSFLNETFGAEPFEWRWENLHTLTLEPPLFAEAAKNPEASGALKLIVRNLMNKGPYPVRGHEMSPNNGEYSWTDPYDMILGPSIRRIVDFQTPGYSLSVLPAGQSGNPLSQYYGDQTESWLNGEYKFLYQDSSLFEEVQYRTMKLIPAK